MTVSSSLNKIIYTGDGTTKTFSVPFYVIAEEDIEIILVEISTQNETIVTSNYEIAPTGGSFPADTATVTYPLNDETPVTSDYNIVLYRYLDYVQETVYPNNTSLKPKVIERSLDKLTMQVQQLSEEVGRAVTVGVASTTTPTELMAELTTYVSDAGASATSSAEFASASSASATSASGYASDALQSVSDAQDIVDTIDFASEAEATAGTLETKVMSPSTTKNAMLEYVYPIGSIYLNVNNTSPATFLGGTWEALSEGRMLMAQGTTYTAGTTGGEATHVLIEAELPAHKHLNGVGDDTTVHDVYGSSSDGMPGNATRASRRLEDTLNSSDTQGYTSTVGSGTAHNNMPPYLAVYMWKRTA